MSAATSVEQPEPAVEDWRLCPDWCASGEHTKYGTDDDGRVLLDHIGRPWGDAFWFHVVYAQETGEVVDFSVSVTDLDEVVFRDAETVTLFALRAQMAAAWLRGEVAVP